MKKKTLCIALTLFLALSAAACSTADHTAQSSLKAPVSTVSADTKENSTTGTESSGELIPRITGERSTSADRGGSMAEDYMTEEAAADSYGMADGAKSFTARSAAKSDTVDGAYEGAPVINTTPTTSAAAEPTAPTKPASTETPATEPPAVEAPAEASSDRSTEASYAPAIGPEEPDIPEVIELPYDDPDIPEVIEWPEIEPQAGLLTAGEWNDNKNWGFFRNLVNAGTIQFPSYGIDPRYRYRVEVKAADGSTVVNAKATLYNGDNQPLWTALTDKEGIVYLFASSADEGVWCTVESNGETKEASFAVDQPVTSGQQGDPQQQTQLKTTVDTASVTFDTKGTAYQKTDIMFILDATGSMSDEMQFLQKEFTAISQDVGDENTRYSVNFYRDHGDDYVTKCYDFTKDIQGLQQKLNEEYATGGGDTPEAIAEILEETIGKANWDEEAVKLAFLIFDAPPHAGTEQSLLQSIKSAAEKGIHIIPVVSSGSERDTELFGRAAAIVTNGTYIFLTDDSGIGYSHMEPIIGDYQVEKLYDIVVRVINNYKQ